jgi:hypothetical protein
MGRFFLGFFVAALIFVPDRTVNVVAAVGANLDKTLTQMIGIGENAVERTKEEILRREIENKLKLGE